jgi:hypothetical protein
MAVNVKIDFVAGHVDERRWVQLRTADPLQQPVLGFRYGAGSSFSASRKRLSCASGVREKATPNAVPLIVFAAAQRKNASRDSGTSTPV